MINTLIFDFGDVFINLDKKGAMDNALKIFNLVDFEKDMINANVEYEIGKLSTEKFFSFYTHKFPHLTEYEVIDAWNYIIKDFPEHRLKFIQDLAKEKKYKLILLSNTNASHIDFIKENVEFFNDFKNCFDAFYLSHEINLRKPGTTIFDFVIDKNNLNPENCLFIDDTKENTDTASKMGFHIWNIDETKEDVVNLFQTKKDLF